MANNQQAEVTQAKSSKSLIDMNNLYFPDGLILSSPTKQSKNGITMIGGKAAESIEYEHLVHFYINETKSTTGVSQDLLGESTDGVVPRSQQGKNNPVAQNNSAQNAVAGGAIGAGAGLLLGGPVGAIVGAVVGGIASQATKYVENAAKAAESVAAATVIRTKATISLPMPQNIATSYINNWQMESNDSSSMMDTVKSLGAQAEVKVRDFMTNTMKAATGKSNVVQSAMTYQGPVNRSFQFQWDFYPTTPAESKRLWAIIQMFKWCSLPELIDSGRFYHVPHTFDIEYRYRGKRNDFLPMTSTCALTSMNVQYTPVGHWAAFDPFEVGVGGDPVRHAILQGLEGAPPVGITLALDFTELDLLTKNKIDPELNLTFNTTAFESGAANAKVSDKGFY